MFFLKKILPLHNKISTKNVISVEIFSFIQNIIATLRCQTGVKLLSSCCQAAVKLLSNCCCSAILCPFKFKTCFYLSIYNPQFFEIFYERTIGFDFWGFSPQFWQTVLPPETFAVLSSR